MSRPIYIVVTSFFPRPESWRGAFCYDFVKALQKTGKYDVRVFVGGNGPDYEYHGIKVCRFETKHFPCNLFPFLFLKHNLGSFLKKVSSEGISWNDVSVYHAHDIFYGCYSAAVKRLNPLIKTLLHNHSGPLFHVSNIRFGRIPIHSDILYMVFKKMFESIDLLVCVSYRQLGYTGKWYANGYLKEPVDLRKGLLFGRMLPEWKVRRSVVLYNGIDASIFNKGEERKAHAGFVVGCVGNINADKDQMTLLKAGVLLKDRIPGLKIVLVGSGPKEAACRKFVIDNAMADILEIKKEVDHLKLPELYRSFDLFVLPSHIEGFCCSYMESYGCGTPFMGCRGVSVEEAIAEGERDKWLFAPENHQELASRIEQFYLNQYKQHLSRDFDIDKLIEEFVKVI